MPATQTISPGARVLGEVAQDLRLWLYCMGLLSLPRVGLILTFHRVWRQPGYGSVRSREVGDTRFRVMLMAWRAGSQVWTARRQAVLPAVDLPSIASLPAPPRRLV